MSQLAETDSMDVWECSLYIMYWLNSNKEYLLCMYNCIACNCKLNSNLIRKQNLIKTQHLDNTMDVYSMTLVTLKSDVDLISLNSMSCQMCVSTQNKACLFQNTYHEIVEGLGDDEC